MAAVLCTPKTPSRDDSDEVPSLSESSGDDSDEVDGEEVPVPAGSDTRKDVLELFVKAAGPESVSPSSCTHAYHIMARPRRRQHGREQPKR